MIWTIPGTTLQSRREDADHICETFQALFLAGGLTLSQISSITGLETHTIQNWVKRGYLTPPKNKRYDMEQLCRIITIHMLRGSLTIEQVCSLMTYVNGNLADDSDDLIDDALLYFMFVRLAARARHIGGTQNWEDALVEATAEYVEPVPGARKRVIEVLRIMLTAWIATCLRITAEKALNELEVRSQEC